MKHFQKFLTPYSTKVKLTLNPEGAQGALYYYDALISLNKYMPRDWRAQTNILIRLFKTVV